VYGTIEWATFGYKIGGGPTITGLLPTNVSGPLDVYITSINENLLPTILTNTPTAGGSGPAVNISSSLLTLNYTTPAVNLAPGDKVEFRLKQDFASTGNYTASFVTGSNNSYLITEVASIGQGGYPYAGTGSNGFIDSINDITSLYSVIALNSEVSSFYGYEFVPYFISGGVAYTSSLYSRYGDINVSLQPQFGDKIVMSDFSGLIQEVDIVSTTVTSSLLTMVVTPQVVDNWVLNPKQVSQFLLLRKYADEQNVILTFNKAPGQTSYGFLIPETISEEVTSNINTLQASVQSQILTQQSISPDSAIP
jgi:hypothetical protein